MERFEQLKTWSKRPRNKKRIYAVLVLIVVLWVIGRFAMVAAENRLFVFNPARAAADSGQIVEVIEVKNTSGVLTEPVTVKANRAMVSSGRVGVLKPGQKIGDGVIVSVSRGIDLDTGMHTVRTRGVSDGMNYAEYEMHGFFVPAYAVVGSDVFVVDGGRAVRRHVNVARTDADTAVIVDGLRDGDMVILSRVGDGVKVKIKK